MQAFKAANPGCVLADFVRWYSPRDWIPVGDNLYDVGPVAAEGGGVPESAKASVLVAEGVGGMFSERASSLPDSSVKEMAEEAAENEGRSSVETNPETAQSSCESQVTRESLDLQGQRGSVESDASGIEHVESDTSGMGRVSVESDEEPLMLKLQASSRSLSFAFWVTVFIMFKKYRREHRGLTER